MYTALVRPNLSKPKALSCTASVVSKLKEYGITPIVCDISIDDVEFTSLENATEKCDFVIVIGGDGTIIHNAGLAIKKPLLGINVGTLGFMTELECTDLHKLKRLAEGKFSVEKRMMLNVNNKLCLNDVVISNGFRIIDLDVYCDDKFISTYRADGIIIATPTGSTAYSLSAGGPIIEPCLNSFILTPICPHSLSTRPVMFADNHTLKIVPSKNNINDVFATLDGTDYKEKVDEIVIKKSNNFAQLISLNDTSFYEAITNKFSK